MAQTGQEKHYSSLAKGLITEAPFGRFPEDATVDEDNMILHKDGSRQRRPGIAFEAGSFPAYLSQDVNTLAHPAYSVHEWKNVNNDGNLVIAVVQTGSKLYFYKLTSSTVSAAYLNGGDSVILTNTEGKIYPTEINGKFIIPAGDKIHILSYDAAADEVTTTTKTVKVRDIWGVVSTEDGEEIANSYRPVDVLDDTHKYNLYNQGFPARRVYCYRPDAGGKRLADALDYCRYGAYSQFATGTGGIIGQLADQLLSQNAATQHWPANTDVYSTAITTSPNSPPTSIKGFDPLELIQNTFTTPAPRGSMVINPFIRDASRIGAVYNSAEGNVAAHIKSLPDDRDTGGLTCATSFAQRVFYAAQVETHPDHKIETTPNHNNTIFFTQVINDDTDLGKCYAEADPGAPDENALVATDGGTIPIPQAATIHRLIATARSVIVLASNGVWEITSIESGFSATSFEVNKISSEGCVGADTVVEADGNVFYWSYGGVYVLSPGETGMGFVASNITESTIATFYRNIPGIQKENASVVYDPYDRKIRWMYPGWDTYDGTTFRYKYLKELVFDTTLGAWTPMSIHDIDIPEEPELTSFIAGAVVAPNFAVEEVEELVIDNGGDAVTAGGVAVTVTQDYRTAATSKVKYLALENASEGVWLSFAEYSDDTYYRDWRFKEAEAYLETGYEMLGDLARDKQGVYLVAHFKSGLEEVVTDGGQPQGYRPTKPDGCIITPKWTYAVDDTTGKWANSFEGIRYSPRLITSIMDTGSPYPEHVITSKTKLRGKGNALRLRFNSKEKAALYGYTLHLVGWSIVYTAGRAV